MRDHGIKRTEAREKKKFWLTTRGMEGPLNGRVKQCSGDVQGKKRTSRESGKLVSKRGPCLLRGQKEWEALRSSGTGASRGQ